MIIVKDLLIISTLSVKKETNLVWGEIVI